MSARHLVVGLDGADLALLRTLGPRVTPTLHALMAEGAFAPQRSVLPVSTLPNWTSFLTGLDPAGHGVVDFTLRHGYRVRFLGGAVRLVPTWVAALDAAGLRCALLGFPGTWPPERLRHGVVVSGWDAPVARAGVPPCWPPELAEDLAARGGEVAGDDVDEFAARRKGWHDALASRLSDRIERRLDLARWLLRRRSWDVFLVYFGEGDTAAHHLWAHFDPASPRRPPGPVSPRAAEGLARVWGALDEALGVLLRDAGGIERVQTTVLGDHGSGGAGDRVLYLNRLLAEMGLLRFRSRGRLDALASSLRRELPPRLPPSLRSWLFHLGRRAGADALESATRFGGIDFSGTVAFSEELNYAPAVWLNVRGREPRGVVAPHDVGRVRRLVADALRTVRDPWDGGPLVEAVLPREGLFEPGPGLHRVPDLLLRLRSPDGYTWNLLPSGEVGPGVVFRRLDPAERLGRKGRALAGSHRERGFALFAGPDVRAVGQLDWRIEQTALTVLARLGAPVPSGATARPCWEVLREPRRVSLRSGASRSAVSASIDARPDTGSLAARLRALGYID